MTAFGYSNDQRATFFLNSDEFACGGGPRLDERRDVYSLRVTSTVRGDFEDTSGGGADAVDIIDRFSRLCEEDDQLNVPTEELRSDLELHEMIASGEPFSDLPDFLGRRGNSTSTDVTFSEFIGSFRAAYEHGSTGEHVAELLAYAAFRNPDVTKLLHVQWRNLCNFDHMRSGCFDLSDDSMEELIAPIARAGIGALMMVGKSGDVIRKIYDVLRRGRYS